MAADPVLGEKLRRSKYDPDSYYSSCWVCSRQHHSACVGQATFICAACQRRTQERCVGAGNASNHHQATPVAIPGGGNIYGTPGGTHGGAVAITRSGRRAGVAVYT